MARPPDGDTTIGVSNPFRIATGTAASCDSRGVAAVPPEPRSARWMKNAATKSEATSATDAAMRVTTDAVQVFGGYGFVLAPPAPVLAVPERHGRIFDGTITINGREESSAAALAWAGIATFPNLPSTVLPVGESGGLPCGMQVMGAEWADLDCIAAAGAIGALMDR